MPKKAGGGRLYTQQKKSYFPRTCAALATVFRESGLALQVVFCMALVLLVLICMREADPSLFSRAYEALPSPSSDAPSSTSSSSSSAAFNGNTIKGMATKTLRQHANSNSDRVPGSSSSSSDGSRSSSSSVSTGNNIKSSDVTASSSGSLSSWMSTLNLLPVLDNSKESAPAKAPTLSVATVFDPELQKECTDATWCEIPIPTESMFGFDPPDDIVRWQRARIAASKGEHILLNEINKIIDGPFDFLDGDPNFRRHHYMVDVFVDEEHWLAPITKSNKQYHPKGAPGSSSGKEGIKTDSYERVPPPYNYTSFNRAPIVQIGYSVINKNANSFFSGDMKGYLSLSRKDFLKEWSEVKDDIKTPFIAMSLSDPDWGWLSSYAQGRTKDRGRCCGEEGDEFLQAFLDDPNALMLIDRFTGTRKGPCGPGGHSSSFKMSSIKLNALVDWLTCSSTR